MDDIKNKKNKIIELVEKNDLIELKKYVQNPCFKQLNLNNKYKYDILLYSIKNNKSFGIIKFIIDQWSRDINRYSYVKQCFTEVKEDKKCNVQKNFESPLSLAIANNNFRVADYLLEHEAILKDIPEPTLLNIINKKNSKYLLNKNIQIRNEFLLELIKSIKLYFIKDIFNYYPYNNTIIINLLLMYKKGIRASTSDLKNIVHEENNKVTINEEMYKEAFNIYFSYEDFLKSKNYEKDYELLFILYNNDRREKEKKLMDIYKVLRDFYDDQKIELINKMKEQKPKFTVDPSFLNTLEKSVSNQKKEDIMIGFVQNNSLIEIQNYMKENSIKLTDLKGEYNNTGICYYELLNRALWNENESLIKYLIDCGADINIPDEQDRSPLHLQLHISQILKDGKDVRLVKKLIEWGADVNKVLDGETPLIKAVKMNHMELVQYMVEKGADINKVLVNNEGDTALGAAIFSRNLKIVKYLMEHGANVHEATFRTEMPLTIALNNEDKEMLKCLIEHGIDLNSKKNPYKQWESGALGHAAFKNNMAMVKYLMKCGAKISAEALIAAVEGNNIEMVQYFIDAGADVNQETQYYGHKSITPLHVALHENNQAMVDYLINHGATVVMDDTNENSHLNAAIMGGNVNIIKYLMDWSLDPIKNPSFPQNIRIKGNAYDINEKYNLNDDREDSYLPIIYLLDSYMEHFKS